MNDKEEKKNVSLNHRRISQLEEFHSRNKHQHNKQKQYKIPGLFICSFKIVNTNYYTLPETFAHEFADRAMFVE